MRLLSALLLGLLVAAPAFAEDPKDEKPLPHEDKVVKEARERFKKDFDDPDMDKRIRILRWYGMHMHKTVLKDLKKIFLTDKSVELQAVAAEGLGNQLPYPRDASIALMTGLKKHEDYASRELVEGDPQEYVQDNEARVLTNALHALGKLGQKPDKKGWKLIRNLIDHFHDDVAIAMLNWCGATKEWRSLPIILEWFNFYPDGYSWSGASASVDTGAAGNKDANAAKAKVKAKLAGRAKKARPQAHEAMKKALKAITGKDFEKPKELQAWMDENKQLLKKNGM
jgi:hypothetical protein